MRLRDGYSDLSHTKAHAISQDTCKALKWKLMADRYACIVRSELSVRLVGHEHGLDTEWWDKVLKCAKP